jgi:signal transduction histidine kinase
MRLLSTTFSPMVTYWPQPVSLSRRQRTLVALGSLLLLALTGFGDWYTGPNLPFALFYLVPLCFTVWFLGRAAGFAMAVASAGVWLWAEFNGAASYSHPLYAIWNCLLRLAFFVVVDLWLSGWRAMGDQLARMVDERTAELRKEVVQRETATQRLKELAAELSQAEQAERRRLAHELHDGPLQMLMLLKLNLETPQPAGEPGACVDAASPLQIVDDLISQTRALTFELHPAMLDDLGLSATLNWYARQFEQRARVEVSFTEHGQNTAIPRVVANYLFRAVKELISNAVRHGKAKEIVIGLHWLPGRVRVVVDDDGMGFDAAEALSPEVRKGLGLAGIQERLSSLGGALRLESKHGQGTRAILEVPLEQGPP